MPMIESLLEAAKKREDCEFWPPTGIPIVPDGCKLPDDLAWFYSKVGGGRLCRTTIDDDVPEFWAWTIVSRNELKPLEEVANPYKVPHDYISRTEARFAFLFAISGSRNVDIAVLLGGAYQGHFVKVERDSLLPGARIGVVAESFTELFERLCSFQVMRGHEWLSSGPHIVLS